ncbi:MAG: TRAP transporter substrate-binding protein DctP [Roseitalea sp.]|nr:TRAP transporter substrate-binding protein DctP [Roseitalea sp.]MBO6720452.1 TRAP transporter substrate-binding protein DctP [Roseitalea sp.]MBO6742812.1 TRAP transporter substrate-binding protein DctP [Roseitalea sp.]
MALAAIWTSPAFAETQLRAIGVFNINSTPAVPLQEFLDRVEETGGDTLSINYLGGPSAMPPFEVGSAVSRGVVDIAYVPGSFYTAQMPEVEVLRMSEYSVAELRETEAWSMLQDLHAEKMNSHLLGIAGEGIEFHLYLTKPVEEMDLTGMNIRVTPVYRPFFEELGATVVRTSPGDVYTALERGTIDGYGWASFGLFDFGWDEFTTHRVDPGFYQTDFNFLVNLETWNGLSDDEKKVLTDAMAWVEERNVIYADNARAELARQDEAGIEAITFADGQWLAKAKETGWAHIEGLAPEHGPRLRELVTIAD